MSEEEMQRLKKLLSNAYIGLLKMPHGAERLKLQPVFARLRDAIAIVDHKDAEEVQTVHETVAYNG